MVRLQMALETISSRTRESCMFDIVGTRTNTSFTSFCESLQTIANEFLLEYSNAKTYANQQVYQ